MKKELEAVKFIYETAIDEWNVGTGTRERLDEYCGMLVEALTPPTSDEVCKALSEHIGKNIYYNEPTKEFVQKIFHGNVLNRDEWFISYITETYCDEPNTYTVNNYLPPHLITLIGRFYEGVEK